MNTPDPYPPHILKLQTMEGFLSFFYDMTYHYPKHEEAYDHCESIYERYFGVRRFKEYDSFRVQKSIHYKKK